jgi:hypothetical protein
VSLGAAAEGVPDPDVSHRVRMPSACPWEGGSSVEGVRWRS